jgi:hypothetical protein
LVGGSGLNRDEEVILELECAFVSNAFARDHFSADEELVATFTADVYSADAGTVRKKGVCFGFLNDEHVRALGVPADAPLGHGHQVF